MAFRKRKLNQNDPKNIGMVPLDDNKKHPHFIAMNSTQEMQNKLNNQHHSKSNIIIDDQIEDVEQQQTAQINVGKNGDSISLIPKNGTSLQNILDEFLAFKDDNGLTDKDCYHSLSKDGTTLKITFTDPVSCEKFIQRLLGKDMIMNPGNKVLERLAQQSADYQQRQATQQKLPDNNMAKMLTAGYAANNDPTHNNNHQNGKSDANLPQDIPQPPMMGFDIN